MNKHWTEEELAILERELPKYKEGLITVKALALLIPTRSIEAIRQKIKHVREERERHLKLLAKKACEEEKPEIKVGQVWRNRGGRQVYIITHPKCEGLFPFIGVNVSEHGEICPYWYTKDGRIDPHDPSEGRNDLVELISDAPRNETTSPEVASIAALYMKHDDPNVRMLAASCLTQRG